MDVVVLVITVHCYDNNKAWIRSDIKCLLNQRKMAFKDGDPQEFKRTQNELRVQLREAKEQYWGKLEIKWQNISMTQV